MKLIETHQGDSAIVLGLPHTGTHVPPEVLGRLNARGRALADTDWHIHTLFEGLLEGASTVRTNVHRYVVDVNRDPDGESLYPGQNTTGLCPLTDFDGVPIYEPGQEPDADEIAARRERYHAPYHAALTAELAQVHARHGFAILFDCHSIRSNIPFLFDGTLPDFNIGTNMQTTCALGIERAVEGVCANAEGYSSVTNGRFKGGWTTRHYGRPDQDRHAIQLELAQSTYLTKQAPPWTYDPAAAERLRGTLTTILRNLSNWRPT